MKLTALQRQKTLHHIRLMARLLDARWRIPGTRWRFGADAVFGLVPVVGDLVGVGLSAYLIWQAWTLGISRVTLARMLLNLGVDAVAGVVPAVGDLFDAAFKANIRNLRLLEESLDGKPSGAFPLVPG